MSLCKNRKTMCLIISIILVVFVGIAAVGINNYSKSYGYSNKIIRAMDADDFEKFNKLLAKNGNIDSKRSMFSFAESNNMSPLEYACWLNKFDFVEPLLIKGANPNLEKDGTSVLMLCLVNAKKATEEKLLDTMNLLIEYGADVNYKDKNGVTVLKRADFELNVVNKNLISDEIKSKIIKLLTDSGAE